MSISTLTLGGKRFVVLPESEYRRLMAKAAKGPVSSRRAAKSPQPKAVKDAGDVAESQRRLADPKRVPAAELFRRLGV